MIQQWSKSITALAFFLASGAAFGQAASAPLTVKPEAPDRYVVVPGDTLWSISQRYTDSPWRWPELWNMNKDEIRNPHLIYPGNVLILDRTRGRLSLGDAGTVKGDAGTVKLSPRVRAEPLSQDQIPAIPPSAIEPFLVRPLVIEPNGLDKAPTIVAAQTDRVVLSAGNTVYARGIGEAKEENWYVYRPGRPLVDPDTDQTLGYEAIYLGTASLRRGGEPATLQLTSVVQEVSTGDKLVAAGRAQPVNYVPHAPAALLKGRVMSIYGRQGRVGEAGPLSIITINRGSADGLEAGHVLALYARGGVVRDRTRTKDASDALIPLPDERTGLAFVFRVFDRVSYALIMSATRPVNPLDVVHTP